MYYTDESCRQFVEVLSSKAPVPGGGGASALVGAVGTALGNMVASLTVGKKKYADVENQILSCQEKMTFIQGRLLDLVEEDAAAFEPLSRAYGLPSSTPEEKEYKEKVMEEALGKACEVPIEIMETLGEAISLIGVMAVTGSKIAISDAGVGAALCRAALQGASLNVFINTRSMKDRAMAGYFEQKAEEILSKYVPLADHIYQKVENELRG